MAAAKLGNKIRLGKTFSEESRAKMGASRLAYVASTRAAG
jgi:hypothetical protein